MHAQPELVAAIAENLPIALWVAKAPSGEFAYANDAFREIMGTHALPDVARGGYAEPYGIHTLNGDPYPEERMPFVQALEKRATVVVDDIVIHRRDGGRVHVRAFARPLFDAAGTLTHVMIAFIDITREVLADRARLEGEARMRHALRMESIGSLAGGIAHDFNNLLASIKLLASHLLRLEHDPEKKQSLEHIDQVTESGAQLTRALLRFARRDRSVTHGVSLNDVARTVTELVRRTSDRRIDIVCEALARTGDVLGDPAQIEQVVLNLLMNARDAVAGNGRIVVRTHDRELEGPHGTRTGELPPGEYVTIEVEDSGGGIDPAIADRIFEPYFTTKMSGTIKGTGMGLATAYGVVQAHGGMIEIARSSSSGTTMRVLLPSSGSLGRGPGTSAPPSREVHRGTGLVLVIDDEPLIRSSSAEALRGLGYEAITASDGEEGLEIFRARHAAIHCVIVDLVMPKVSGAEVCAELRKIDPRVPAIVTTGLSADGELDRGSGIEAAAVLAKPYDVAALSEVIARVTKR